MKKSRCRSTGALIFTPSKRDVKAKKMYSEHEQLLRRVSKLEEELRKLKEKENK